MKAHRYAHSTPVAGVSLPLWPAVKEEWEFHFVHVHVCVHVHVHACITTLVQWAVVDQCETGSVYVEVFRF